MSENLFTRKDIVKALILDMVLETNIDFLRDNRSFMIDCINKIRDLKSFFKGVIFLNKNSYFGRYAFSYNSLIIKAVEKKDKDRFLEVFMYPYPSEVHKNKHLDENFKKEFDRHLHYEILAYNYIFEKRYFNTEVPVDIISLQKHKIEIYEAFNISQKSRFLSNKDTILVKKGKEEKIYNINETIIKIFKNVKLDPNLDKYIKGNYKKEYNIIFYYLNNIENI